MRDELRVWHEEFWGGEVSVSTGVADTAELVLSLGYNVHIFLSSFSFFFLICILCRKFLTRNRGSLPGVKRVAAELCCLTLSERWQEFTEFCLQLFERIDVGHLGV